MCRLQLRPPQTGSPCDPNHGFSSLGSELRATRIFCWVSVGMDAVQDALDHDNKVSQRKQNHPFVYWSNRDVLLSFKRFFQEDEETLILTHSDELNSIYSDGSRLPFDLTSTSSDDITGTQPALDEQTPRSSRASWWGKPALKETRATIVPSGSGTITVTSAVTPADTHWFDRRRFGRKSYPPARQLRANTQKQKIWEAEVEKTGGDEGRKGIIPLNPVQNSGGVTERRDATATITAWEAAWNVTNAIQVPKIIS